MYDKCFSLTLAHLNCIASMFQLVGRGKKAWLNQSTLIYFDVLLFGEDAQLEARREERRRQSAQSAGRT